jgi:hypothetical protein
VFYPFDGNANNALGNNFNGVVNGATLAPDRDNTADAAYYFDGASTMVFGDIPLEEGSFSISYWLKTDPSQPVDKDMRYLSKREVCNYGSFFDFQYYHYDTGDGTAGHEVRTNATGTPGIGTNATGLTPGDWTHIVLVIDEATSTSTAYADGVSTGTSSFTVPTGQQLSLANSADFGISISPCLGTNSSLIPFTGEMDDIAVFGRALTAAEVATLAQ